MSLQLSWSLNFGRDKMSWLVPSNSGKADHTRGEQFWRESLTLVAACGETRVISFARCQGRTFMSYSEVYILAALVHQIRPGVKSGIDMVICKELLIPFPDWMYSLRKPPVVCAYYSI
jgi:hypothetical protein